MLDEVGRMKRVFDLVAAWFGLLLLAPLMGAIAVAIKRADGGPALFCQSRVGQYGRPFRMWKFRTMVVDAERLGPALTNSLDPRITPIGRWLRKLKLDELPQLFNVLKGEMSLVGPRPEVPQYVAQYNHEQRQVLRLRPGITDPASLQFYNEEDRLALAGDPQRTYREEIVPEKIRLNLEYAVSSNLIRDLAIIAHTLLRIVTTPIHRPQFASQNERSLRRDVVALSSALFAYSGCQLGLFIVFAQLGSAEALGQYVLGLALTTPVAMFASLQLRLALATDVEHKHSFSEYFLLRCVMTALALIITAAIGVVATADFAMRWTIIAISFAKACEAFSDLCFGRLQRDGKTRVVARSMLIRGPLTLGWVFIAFLLTNSVPLSCAVMALTWFALLLGHDVPVATGPRPGIASAGESNCGVRDLLSNVAGLAWTVAPLGFVMGLGSVEANVPRYVVEAEFGRQALGVFGAIAGLAVVTQPIMNAVCHSCLSRLAQLHASADIASLRILILKMVALITALGGAAVFTMLLFGQRLIIAIFGADFAGHQTLLVLVTAGTAISLINAVLATAIKSTGRFRSVLLPHIMSVIGTTSLCWWLARVFGLNGIGLAVLIVAVMNLIVFANILRSALAAAETTPKQRYAAAA